MHIDFVCFHAFYLKILTSSPAPLLFQTLWKQEEAFFLLVPAEGKKQHFAASNRVDVNEAMRVGDYGIGPCSSRTAGPARWRCPRPR